MWAYRSSRKSRIIFIRFAMYVRCRAGHIAQKWFPARASFWATSPSMRTRNYWVRMCSGNQPMVRIFIHIYCQHCIRESTAFWRKLHRISVHCTKIYIQIKLNAAMDFLRYGLPLRNDFVWDNGKSRQWALIPNVQYNRRKWTAHSTILSTEDSFH